ncbi:MAG: 30S ribosomal protein S1 [Candidatus Firestonebacteria bacterium]
MDNTGSGKKNSEFKINKEDDLYMSLVNQENVNVSTKEVDTEKETIFSMDEIYKSLNTFEEKSLVKGTVVHIGKEEVFIDIGYKSEGIVPIREFSTRDGQLDVKIGDKIEVFLEKKEDEEGALILSKFKADRKRNIDAISKAYDEKETLSAKVSRQVKGGLIVDVGIEVFLPGSQVALEEGKNLQDLIGKIIPVRIIKFAPLKNNIIASHKIVVETEKRKAKTEIWNSLQENDLRKGIVKNITTYGAFIDLGGADGLLHISDMSWTHINHPAEMLALGNEIEVLVLKVDRNEKKISLGLKQKTADPWLDIDKKYPQNTVIRGKVVNIMDYGVFVKIEEGIEGLVHISEMSWTKRPKHPSEILAIGDTVEASVLNIDKNEKKISLSMRQLESDPWSTVEQICPLGSVVKGAVTSFADFGVFIEIENGIEGLLHVSDMSWTNKIKHPNEVLKKGEKVEVLVLEVDKNARKLSLGLKQLQPDPWKIVEEKFKVGQVITGKVVRLSKFGAFVDLGGEIEGLLHISEIKEIAPEKIEDCFKIDDEVTAKIIKIEPERRKIGLSIKALSQ